VQILYRRIARRRSDQGSPAVTSEIRLQRETATALVGGESQVLIRECATLFIRYVGGVIYRHFSYAHEGYPSLGKMACSPDALDLKTSHNAKQ
jgi:hypothetical protein